jgi:hypothetical protein
MKARSLNNEDAGTNARAAAIRARIYSDECRMRWGAGKRNEAQTFLHCAQAAFTGVRDEPTYRKTFITIRIDGRCRNREAAKTLDLIAQERGYDKVQTPQTLIYRIK